MATGGERPAPAAGAPVEAGRLEQLRRMPYHEYLRTPEWRRARAAALERAGHSCSLDVTHTDDLEVHHRTNERLGEERAADLVVLCRACHRLHHAQYGRPRRRHDAAWSRPAPSPRRAADSAATDPARKRSLLRRLIGR
jgi:5-methylcytosine-specific restriction endonuclease McrA